MGDNIDIVEAIEAFLADVVRRSGASSGVLAIEISPRLFDRIEAAVRVADSYRPVPRNVGVKLTIVTPSGEVTLIKGMRDA